MKKRLDILSLAWDLATVDENRFFWKSPDDTLSRSGMDLDGRVFRGDSQNLRILSLNRDSVIMDYSPVIAFSYLPYLSIFFRLTIRLFFIRCQWLLKDFFRENLIKKNYNHFYNFNISHIYNIYKTKNFVSIHFFYYYFIRFSSVCFIQHEI